MEIHLTQTTTDNGKPIESVYRVGTVRARVRYYDESGTVHCDFCLSYECVHARAVSELRDGDGA